MSTTTSTTTPPNLQPTILTPLGVGKVNAQQKVFCVGFACKGPGTYDQVYAALLTTTTGTPLANKPIFFWGAGYQTTDAGGVAYFVQPGIWIGAQGSLGGTIYDPNYTACFQGDTTYAASCGTFPP